MRKSPAHYDGSVHKLISMSGLTSHKRYGVILMFCSCPVLRRLPAKKCFYIVSGKGSGTYFIFVADAADIVRGENFVLCGQILDVEIFQMWRYLRYGDILEEEKFHTWRNFGCDEI